MMRRVETVLGVCGPLLAAVCAAVAFSNSLHGDFVFDDLPAIKDNKDVNPDTPWTDVFKDNFWGQEMGSRRSQHYSFRPLTTLTFRWNVVFFGWDTYSFHVVNLAAHALCSALIVLVAKSLFAGDERAPCPAARRTLKRGTKGGEDTCAAAYATSGSGVIDWICAMIAGCVFAVHPVHAEAVSNIVCRAELLAGIFWCLAFLAYDRILLRCPRGASWLRAVITFPLVAALTALSVACKEQGIMVLPSLAAYDLVFFSGIFDALFLARDRAKACASGAGEDGVQEGTRQDIKPIQDTAPAESKGAGSALQGKRSQKKAKKGDGDSRTHAEDDAAVTQGALKTSASAADGHVPCEEKQSAQKQATQALLRVGVLVLIFAALYGYRLTYNSGGEMKMDLKTNPANHIEDWQMRWLNKNYYVFLHMWLLVFPAQLCCDWSSFGVAVIDSFTDQRNVQTLAFYIAVLFGVAFLLSGRRDTRRVRYTALCALAVTAATFLPASGAFLEVGFVVAERVLYLPALGVSVLFALGCKVVLQQQQQQQQQQRRTDGKQSAPKTLPLSWRVAVVVLAVVGLLGLRTYLRNAEWRNVETLNYSGLQVLPNNAKLHHNYAHSIAATDKKAAEHHYRAAIYIYPHYGSAYINLGVILAQSGRLDEAVRTWREGLQRWKERPIVGSDPSVLNANIGLGLMNSGKGSEAVPYFKECLRYEPGKAMCINNLRRLGVNV